MMRTHLPGWLLPMAGLLAGGCGSAGNPASSAAAAVDTLADDYRAWLLERTPESAYFAAVDVERHDGLHDNSPAALAAAHEDEDRFRQRLDAIRWQELAGRPQWVTATMLERALDTAIAVRVCRNELWNVNQMDGWHLNYPRIAELQPVTTADERAQALVRWRSFPGFVAREQMNLATGLAAGWSAPRSVVERVVVQLDGLLALPAPELPLLSPARRSGDPDFAATFERLVAGEILPAIRTYRDYLAGDYRDAARTALAVTENPDGAACYEASLRGYTTLDKSGREIYEQGRLVVEKNRAAIVEIGRQRYGTDSFAATVQAALLDPADRFADADELLAFSRDAVTRAARQMPGWVGRMPDQAVDVVPFPPHEEGTGRSAYYRPGNPGRPAEYRIPLHDPGAASRGNAEATAFHETWPGHHLQVATAQAVESLHPVTELLWFSGPGEGWARYAEGLAEDMGLYETGTGPLLRRAWPAHGMVVDPGIHLFGWSREQAITFMVETGRFPPEQGDSMVDRIAILPGQLTAYDAGGLEILALRNEAETVLGDKFDIREFHDRVLEPGTIPLDALRDHVERWIRGRAAP